MTSHMHLYNEREEEQGGGEFMEDKNFTRGKKFRMWLQYLKLILFKEDLLIFI